MRLGSGEDLFATTEGEDGVSVEIPVAEVIILSTHIRFTQARANGRTGRTTEMIQLY